MTTITDKVTADELITRINSLNQNSQPLWGKMNVYQMLGHLIKWEEMAMEKTIYKQSFLGKVVGKFALKDMLKEGPIKQNLPTVPDFKMSGDGEIAAEQQKLTELLKEHEQYADRGFMHPFFGQLTPLQAGHMAYKHTDHHLKQFGV